MATVRELGGLLALVAVAGLLVSGCGGGGGGGGGAQPVGVILSAPSVTLQAPQGGADPAPQTVDISTDAGSINWYARSSSSWLTIDKTSGTTPDSVTLTASIAGIPAGEYHAKVWVSSPDEETRAIEVTLNITDGPPPSAGAEWTILVYMNADNNLEDYALRDLNEMERVGSSSKVNIIAMIDRSPGSPDADGSGYSAADGDWTTTRVYLVKADSDPNHIASEMLFEGELNLADPDSLYGFLATGVEDFPALRYGVVLWNHGLSWLAVGSDDSSGDVMDAVGAAIAMETAAIDTGISFYDLLVMNQCVNASVETAFQVSDFVNTFVGSEDLMPATGFDYQRTFAALKQKPAMSDLELGERFARDYLAASGAFTNFSDRLTCSVIDLLMLPDLIDALDEFAVDLEDAMPVQSRYLANAMRSADNYGTRNQEGSTPNDFIDLAEAALIVGELTPLASLQTDALNLYASVTRAVFFHDNSEGHLYSHGLSIYAPASAEHYFGVGYAFTRIAQATAWNEMLAAFYNRLAIDGTAPVIQNLATSDATVSEQAPISISATIPSSDAVNAMVYGGLVTTGAAFELLFQFETAPAELVLPTGKPISAWGQGATQISEGWDSTLFKVSDGVQSSFASVTVARRSFEVPGVHRSAGLNDDKLVSLLFNEDKNLVRCYEASDDALPREIVLRPGDEIDVLTMELDFSTPGSIKFALVEQGSFLLSNAGLHLEAARASNGDYVVGVLCDDAAGNFSTDAKAVTVDNQ